LVEGYFVEIVGWKIERPCDACRFKFSRQSGGARFPLFKFSRVAGNRTVGQKALTIIFKTKKSDEKYEKDDREKFSSRTTLNNGIVG
jgi:hypothetical protein